MKRRRVRPRVIRIDKSSRRAAYRAYMNSPQWRKFRLAWLATYDSKYRVRTCYVCGISQQEYGQSFDLHHRTYERFGGAETFQDCVIVCRPCHAKITKAWRARGRTGLALSLWQLTDDYRDKARKSPRVAPVAPKAPTVTVVRVGRRGTRSAARRAS